MPHPYQLRQMQACVLKMTRMRLDVAFDWVHRKRIWMYPFLYQRILSGFSWQARAVILLLVLGVGLGYASSAQAVSVFGNHAKAEPTPLPSVIVNEQNVAAIDLNSMNHTYTVQEGDTVAQIALWFGVDPTALRALNNLPLHEPPLLIAGQKLTLPATPWDLNAKSPAYTHTVNVGDTLSGIAERYGVDLRGLMVLNRITNPNYIVIGSTLKIPSKPLQRDSPAIGLARSGFLYHRVELGETISALSLAFDTTPMTIVEYNGLPDESTLYFGREIRVPYGPPQLERRLPPTPISGTEFVVSLSRQRCWVMRNRQIIFEWKCSTGYGQWMTKVGTFPIKTRMEIARSSAYRLNMPFWLGLYDVGEFENGIHGLPVEWESQEKLWDSLVGQPATFGCAMLLDDHAQILYDISYINMPVHIVN